MRQSHDNETSSSASREIKEALEALVPGLKAGDDAAFVKFSDWLHPNFLRFFAARRMPLDQAEECVQELLARIFLSVSGYRAKKDGGLRAWVYRIAVNVAADRGRKQGPVDAVDELPELEAAAAELLLPAGEGPIAQPQLSYERTVAIEDALAQLPQLDQEMLFLRYFATERSDEDRSLAAIARTIGMKPDAARKRFERVKAKLAALLDPHDPRLHLRRADAIAEAVAAAATAARNGN